MSDTTPSGRFVLRLPPTLHALLREAAAQRGQSLNEHCVQRLTVGDRAPSELEALTHRARAILGTDLVGLILFGSYARGTEGPESDVDLLIVTAATLPITRALYDDWDTAPLSLDGHDVEPHIVRMPDAADRVTGLWAEVALDGAVIHDPTLNIARHLAHVRRRIIDGELVRRTVQGQNYWTAA